MPRTRLINPEFFLHEGLGSCSAHARLLFIALWTQADREGRLRWLPLKVHGETFPHEPAVKVPELASELIDAGTLTIYAVNGRAYAHVSGFTTWQNPHRNESHSKHPEPPAEMTPSESLLALEQPKNNQGTTKRQSMAGPILVTSSNSLVTSSTSPNGEVCPAQHRTGADAGPPKSGRIETPTGDDVLDYLLTQWGPLLGSHKTLPKWLASAKDAYPGTDLLAEAKRAAAWEMSRPANKKKQVRSFLTRWWGRQQDRGGGRSAATSTAEADALAAARKLGATL